MKHLQKLIFFLFALSLGITVLACKPTVKELTIPFTEMTWDNTLENIKSVEGEIVTTSPSAYNGTIYTFEKEYLGVTGNIKYSFDEENALKSVGWMYSSASIEELETLYQKVCSEAEKSYGKCGVDTTEYPNMKNSSVIGKFWYLDDGNIQVLLVYAGDDSVFQVQYVHPDVASENPNSVK